MLDLSRVTLLFVETRAHAITKRVIDDCMAKAQFGGVLIYSDKPALIPVAGARYYTVPDFPNKKEAGRFYYQHASAATTTDFALMLEWDGGIFNADAWKPEFFDYDYIGAPWIVRADDPYDVGNGGFTLMSKRLADFVHASPTRYPVTTDWDFCRIQRRHLEGEHGFKWPDRDLASAFSWELGPRNPNHFGYHGAFNWPTVLPHEEVVARAKIMVQSPYLITKMRDLVRACPQLELDFTPDELARYHQAVPPRPGHVVGQAFPGHLSAQQRAAMMLMQAQRRGLITARQQEGLKA